MAEGKDRRREGSEKKEVDKEEVAYGQKMREYREGRKG